MIGILDLWLLDKLKYMHEIKFLARQSLNYIVHAAGIYVVK